MPLKGEVVKDHYFCRDPNVFAISGEFLFFLPQLCFLLAAEPNQGWHFQLPVFSLSLCVTLLRWRIINEGLLTSPFPNSSPWEGCPQPFWEFCLFPKLGWSGSAAQRQQSRFGLLLLEVSSLLRALAALKLAITGQGMEKAPGKMGFNLFSFPERMGFFQLKPPGASVSPQAPPVTVTCAGAF